MKKAARALALLLLAAALGALCNVAACAIDTPAMREHAAQALETLSHQDARPEVVGGFLSAQLDNFTTVIILKTAAYTGPEPLLMRAFGGLRAEFPPAQGQSAWDALFAYGDGGDVPTGGLSYSRYWHGYMLPLRLLLCALALPNLQMLLLFAQLALIVLVCLLMERRGLIALLPGFLAAYFLMMPPATALCLQYVPVSMLTLLGCAALLRFGARLDKLIGLPGFFALLGLLVNYFDLLTFPLTSLGFPLVLALCLEMRAPGEGTASGLFLRAAACCAAWGAGYGGMWLLKWAINALALGPDFVAGIFGQAALRLSSSSNGNDFSRLSALALNLRVLTGKAAYLLLVPAVGVATLARALLGARGGALRLNPRALALLMPLALPFAWLLVFANHAYDHAFYTYRILTFAVFAAYALLAYGLTREDGGTEG